MPKSRTWEILGDFTWRELHARYRSSWFSAAWIILDPLILLGVYTLVFSGVLGVRYAAGADHLDYAVSLGARLSVFTFFSQTLSEAPGRIASQAYLVKKMVFPLPVLVVSRTLADLGHLAAALGVVWLVHAARGGASIRSLVEFPLALFPTLCFCLGAAFLLSALGVFLPDLREFMPHVCRLLLYLSPVFYPITAVPEKILALVRWNPASRMIEPLHRVLIENAAVDWKEWGVFTAASLGMLALGVLVFWKLRRGFADVL